MSAGDPSRFERGLVDMRGWTRDGWTVLERAGNVAGSAAWRVQHRCGAVEVRLGTQLRAKPAQWCDACRPKRPGTVELTGKLRPRRRTKR